MAPPPQVPWVPWTAPVDSAAPDAGARARGRGPACSSRHAGARSTAQSRSVEGRDCTGCTLLARPLTLARPLPTSLGHARPVRGTRSELRAGAAARNLDGGRGRGRRSAVSGTSSAAAGAGSRRGPRLGAVPPSVSGGPRPARAGRAPVAAARRTRPSLAPGLSLGRGRVRGPVHACADPLLARVRWAWALLGGADPGVHRGRGRRKRVSSGRAHGRAGPGAGVRGAVERRSGIAAATSARRGARNAPGAGPRGAKPGAPQWAMAPLGRAAR